MRVRATNNAGDSENAEIDISKCVGVLSLFETDIRMCTYMLCCMPHMYIHLFIQYMLKVCGCTVCEH